MNIIKPTAAFQQYSKSTRSCLSTTQSYNNCSPPFVVTQVASTISIRRTDNNDNTLVVDYYSRRCCIQNKNNNKNRNNILSLQSYWSKDDCLGDSDSIVQTTESLTTSKPISSYDTTSTSSTDSSEVRRIQTVPVLSSRRSFQTRAAIAFGWLTTTLGVDHTIISGSTIQSANAVGVSSSRIDESSSSSSSALEQIQVARDQLLPIPELIQNEQWDNIRAILVKPPLSDCWTKSSKKVPLLQQYAINEVNDEFAALELKEELQGHLRFLDMAVYNNVFNPIKTVGTAGATKTLIDSYYNDPVNEYKASIRTFNELIELATPKTN